MRTRLSVACILALLASGCGSAPGAVDSPGSPTQALPPVSPDPVTSSQARQLHRGPAHPERTTVIDGSWLIGTDYPPALYLVPVPVSRCTWRVVDYSTGALIEEGSYAGPGPAAIWVEDGDLFQSEGCLLWQGYAQLTGARTAGSPAAPSAGTAAGMSSARSVGDGAWTAGVGIPAGRYRSDRASFGACAFQVDRAGAGDDEAYRSSSRSRSIPAYLDLRLAAGDILTTTGCGDWSMIPD